jgi:hypothetical protein
VPYPPRHARVFPAFLPRHRFLHFDHTRQPIAAWSHHGPTQLMQPSPRRFIAAQPQDALQPFRAGSVLLAGYPPDRPKPRHQRRARSRKNGPHLDRHLILAPRAVEQRSFRGPTLRTATAWTDKPLGPAQLKKIVRTCLFGSKFPFKLRQGFRIFFHASGYYI